MSLVHSAFVFRRSRWAHLSPSPLACFPIERLAKTHHLTQMRTLNLYVTDGEDGNLPRSPTFEPSLVMKWMRDFREELLVSSALHRAIWIEASFATHSFRVDAWLGWTTSLHPHVRLVRFVPCHGFGSFEVDTTIPSGRPTLVHAPCSSPFPCKTAF